MEEHEGLFSGSSIQNMRLCKFAKYLAICIIKELAKKALEIQKLELSSDPWYNLPLDFPSHPSPHLLIQHLGGGGHPEEGAERDEPDDHLRLRCQDLLLRSHIPHLWLPLLNLWQPYRWKNPLRVSRFPRHPSLQLRNYNSENTV